MILHHHYDEQDQPYSQNQSESQRSIIPLKSIKQVFNQQSSYAGTEYVLPMFLSNRVKGMILCGILFKERQRKIRNVKTFFYKWYAKSNDDRCSEAIDKFMTFGKLSKQKYFYKLKIMAKRLIKAGITLDSPQINGNYNQSDGIDPFKTQKNTEIKPKSSHNREKAVIELNKFKRVSKTEPINQAPQILKQNIGLKQQIKRNKDQQLNQSQKQKKLLQKSQSIKKFLKNQQQNSNKQDQPQLFSSEQSSDPADHLKFPKNKYQSSINNILLQSQILQSFTSVEIYHQSNEGCCNNTTNSNNRQNFRNNSIKIDQINQFQKQKQSISNIDPTSGNLRIQLVTCTNIFQNSQNQQSNNSLTLKVTAAVDICRLSEKFRNKIMHLGFRKIIQVTAFQENYQQELLKARRNLQLVEQNFMVQCQIDAITQNYQEQNEHLESIDKSLQILKQKFLYSKTNSIVRILKKLTYPIFDNFFTALIDINLQNPSLIPTKTKSNIYQIQQLQVVGVSSTSLSNRTYSNNFIRELQDQSQSKRSIRCEDKYFGSQYNTNSYKFGEQKKIDEQEEH